MDDFKDIAYLAQRAANATDLQLKLRLAKQVELLVRSAIMRLKIKLKDSKNGR